MTLDGKRAAALAALCAAFILYGSLYPFDLRAPAPGAWEAALSRRPPGRGDLLANLALYAPFGLFLAAGLRVPPLARVPAVALVAALLSLGVEVAQLHLRGRTSSLWDVGLNVAGALAGAALVPLVARLRPAGGGPPPDRFALLLLLAWLGYRLYPYVPTLDLQALKDALKPLLLRPEWEGLRAARLAVAWLAAALLAEAGLRRAWAAPLLLLGAGVGGEVLISGRSLSLAEAVGVAAALPLWAALRGARGPWAMGALAALLALAVLASRLAPFDFSAPPKAFVWVPFRSLIGGSWQAGLQAVLEKVFLYGALLWAAVAAGMRLPLAAGLGAALLLATSLAQTRIPGRSGEATDALLVLLLALALHLLRSEATPTRTPRPAPDAAAAAPRPPA